MRNAVLDSTVFVSGVAKHGIGETKVLDLRVLSPFRGIEIITVNRFLRRLGVPRRSRKTVKAKKKGI